MPSRGSYQIASQEEHKAAQRDQSYRSCVATLLIFFMLCMVILIACIPWKKYSTSQHNKKEGESAVVERHYGNKPSYDDEPIETDIIVTTATDTETTTDVATDVFTENDTFEKGQKQSFERYYENITTILEPLETDSVETTPDTMNTFSKYINSTDPQNQNKTTVGNVETTKQPELRYNDTSDTTVSDNYEMSESTPDTMSTFSKYINSTDPQDQNKTTVGNVETTKQPELRYNDTSDTTVSDNYEMSKNTRQEETSTMLTTLILEVTNKSSYKTETDMETSKYFTVSMNSTPVSNSELFNQNTSEDIYTTTQELNNTETTTPQTTFSPNTNSSELSTTTDSSLDDYNIEINEFSKEFSTTSEPSSSSTLTEYLTNTTVTKIEDTSTQETVITTEFATETEGRYITNIETTTESNVITASTIKYDTETCDSGHCKQIAARMLSYMNHSADPCEDFYEYACGGMVADSQIIDLNLANKAIHRIAKQMRNSNNDTASLFATYYNSCIQYENAININERIALVNEAINRIGKFYTIHDKVDNYGDFTTMYAKLLNYSPLLFDVEPDLNENSPNLYTIRIGPVLHKNLFDSENIDDFCNASENETQQPFVDLESIYKSYTECKQNNTRFIKSINDALMVLGVFNDTNNIEQNVAITAVDIDTEIVQRFFFLFPSQAKIREAYLMKNYSTVLMKELNRTTTFINWDRLMFLLMKNNVERDADVQIYFYKELVNGLQNLEHFWQTSPGNFQNAVLGLYAYKLYHDLVVSKHNDVEQHCLRVSTNLLGPEASSLYMSSLSDEEIAYMSRTAKTFFNELKDTLKIKIRTTEWMMDEPRQILLTKINNLSLSIPEISYFQYDKSNELHLSDNYINNSLILMKRYRSFIYSVIPSFINPGTPEQIWRRYATPFQSKGVAVYGLNLVIIPFGAIDYGNMSIENDDALSNYLVWATIGNLIARQISHHFDGNGMYYWNQSRHDIHFLMSRDSSGTYINCQKNDMYYDPINMTLPLTSQTISFKISGHTLNARLSEIMGLKLTYDTLERLKLFSNNRLPWLELNVKQLFYLTYAQMYCTKSLLTTSYVSLHENEELPSRIRVFVSASSDRILGESWNCPQGSQIVPSNTCAVFPDTEHDIEIPSA